jgi:transposase
MQGHLESLPVAAWRIAYTGRGWKTMLQALVRCCAGLDVHRKLAVCTVLREKPDGVYRKEVREYATFRKDLRGLALWLHEQEVELAVMESTGVYWKAVFEALEEQAVESYVVNARHVKNVPGRKTDVEDSEWLAELGSCGLLRPSFIPAADFRQLGMLSRYRRKHGGYLSGEKNRLHKVLDDCGIRLGCVVSDIDGVSGRAMVKALIQGEQTPEQIAQLARGQLRKKNEELQLALDGRISDRHRLVLSKILDQIQYLDREIETIDAQIVAAIKPYEDEWKLVQTIPGMDRISAAILLIEIGVDMSRFGSKERISSWAGLCPGNAESAGKRKSGRMRKGNPYVRAILCEAANSARKTHSQFQGLYRGLVIRRGHKRAIMAVAHRMLEIVYLMLTRKEPYRDPGIDYDALIVKGNAPRWIQALAKHGYLKTIRA